MSGDPLVDVIQAAQDANSRAPGPPYETEAESIARAVRAHIAAVLDAEDWPAGAEYVIETLRASLLGTTEEQP